MKTKNLLIGILAGLVIFSLVGISSSKIFVVTEAWNNSYRIYGNIYLLPFYSEGEDINVVCSNDSFSNSTTTNSTGYYMFDTLIAENYWINTSLYNYIDNNVIVEVISDFNESLLNNCDTL